MARQIITPEHDHYERETDGNAPEIIDTAHVARFLDAAPFFDNLVATPETHAIDAADIITVTQHTPEGDARITTFTPLDDCLACAAGEPMRHTYEPPSEA